MIGVPISIKICFTEFCGFRFSVHLMIKNK